MARFSAWMRKHLGSKPTAQRPPEFQLPFLPTPRRSVTLTSFDTPTCSFFQLPYEIRETMLVMALGGCTLHLDIVRLKEGWQWRGAVCHRNQCTVPSMRYAWTGPWTDPCLRYVYGRNGEFLGEYNPGIMGFVLSCRQAYAEGIQILYSANCINIESQPLLIHLPRLIPTDRLQSITSLEVVVTAHRIEQDNGSPSFSLAHLEPILQNINTHCHHLRSFCLSFVVASRGCEIVDGPTLPLVDTFYHSMRLRDMRVELPSVTYWKICDYKSVYHHPREAPAKALRERSPWRSLDGGEPSVQDRSIERYPYPPLKLPLREGEDESLESAGYWLVEGDSGPMQPIVTCS